MSVSFSGGWNIFVSGNYKCDVSFGPYSNEHQCSFLEFLWESVYMTYGFFISGWWAFILIGSGIIYFILYKFKKV